MAVHRVGMMVDALHYLICLHILKGRGLHRKPHAARRCVDLRHSQRVLCRPRRRRSSFRLISASLSLLLSLLPISSFFSLLPRPLPLSPCLPVCLSPLSSSWLELNTTGDGGGPGDRHSHAAVAYNNNVYVFGGFPGAWAKAATQDLWVLNLTTLHWTNLTATATGTVPQPRGASFIGRDNGRWRFSSPAPLFFSPTGLHPRCDWQHVANCGWGVQRGRAAAGHVSAESRHADVAAAVQRQHAVAAG